MDPLLVSPLGLLKHRIAQCYLGPSSGARSCLGQLWTRFLEGVRARADCFTEQTKAEQCPGLQQIPSQGKAHPRGKESPCPSQAGAQLAKMPPPGQGRSSWGQDPGADKGSASWHLREEQKSFSACRARLAPAWDAPSRGARRCPQHPPGEVTWSERGQGQHASPSRGAGANKGTGGGKSTVRGGRTKPGKEPRSFWLSGYLAVGDQVTESHTVAQTRPSLSFSVQEDAHWQ